MTTRLISAFLIGGVFGIGIVLSGMANPAKVVNFFDLAGTWDPSLLFVMGGALATTAIGYRVLFGIRNAPVFDTHFAVPATQIIDRPLVIGSAAFGIGWGIAGFCPGGAIPALGLGHAETVYFIAAMMAGILAGRAIKGSLAATAAA